MRGAAAALAAGALVAGCGGGADEMIVSISASDADGQGTVRALARPHANGRETPLHAVAALVPRPLPEPLAPAAICESRTVVVVRTSSGRTVRYGRCRTPRSIDWLAQAVNVEARQWAARPARTTSIRGARPAERRELRRLLAGMAPTRIRSIRLAPVADARKWGLPPGAVVVRVDAGSSLRGAWEGSLLARTYGDAAARLGLRPPGVVATDMGTSGVGRAPEAAALDTTPLHDLLLRTHVRLVELRRQAGALALTLRTSHPARFLQRDGRRLARAARRAAAAGGVYVGIENAGGAVVYAWGSLPSQGMLVARPDLDSCGPIVHSQPVGYRAPPCPA